jgi:hypothetical protein
LIATMLATLALTWLGLPGSAAGQSFTVLHRGRLVTPGGNQVSGVFPLEFRLFETEGATEAIWQERHFAFVLEGRFQVSLGAVEPLDTELADQELLLGLYFDGAEVLREPLVLKAEESGPEPIPESWRDLTFARLTDLALLAIEAELALETDRLGGRTLEQVNRSGELAERLERHATRRDAHMTEEERRRAIGLSVEVLERFGGTGGTPYEAVCPRGYVVVGMRGLESRMVDQIELICAPLQ